MANSKAWTDEEPLSPGARLFNAPNLNGYIIGIMGWKTSVNPSVIKEGLLHTFIKHPRFSSQLVILGRKMKWIQTIVSVEDHVIVPDLDPEMENPEQFVEDYISYITTTPMDLSKPLWELHLLNVKTSDAEAIGVFRIHHSIGDGASLISLILASARKISDPEELPSIPVQKSTDARAPTGWSWSAKIQFIWNTIVNVSMLMATTIFLKDTETPLKDRHGVECVPKRFVHRTVSLDDIKLVKSALNVVRLCKMEEESKNIYALGQSFSSNFRPTKGIQALTEMMDKGSQNKWGNKIGFFILPLTITLQNDPLDYIRLVKATTDRKKHSSESKFTFSMAKFLQETFGAKVAAASIYKVVSNTTMTSSNMVGPSEEISLYGYPVAYFAPSVYGHPHALTTHFLSYANKMTICLAVDPNVIPDPRQLCQDIEDSLKIIKDATIERGFTRG